MSKQTQICEFCLVTTGLFWKCNREMTKLRKTAYYSSRNNPEVEFAGPSHVLKGSFLSKTKLDRNWTSINIFPGQVVCLLTLPDSPAQALLVVLHNESKHDINIPKNSFS